MSDFWHWVDSNESLTLKSEMAFSAVINCVMTAIALDYTSEQTEKLAVAQGSLFKKMQSMGGSQLQDLLWNRKEGMSIKEFVDNVNEMYSFVVLNQHEDLGGDEHMREFISEVKSLITERGE